jgi:hypothetical protein
MTDNHHNTRQLLAALLLSLALLTGCASDPYGSDSRSAPSASQPPSATTAEEAVRDFTKTYINWNVRTLVPQQRRLATTTSGQLRRTLLTTVATLTSTTAPKDGLMFAGRSNRGTVESLQIDPVGRFYVVTHETADLGTTGRQTSYIIYRGVIQKDHGTFKLSQFRAVS